MLDNDLYSHAKFVSDEPLVSVVIPVYNVSRYLPQCLDSVLQQTYHNLEIIIIDDGSTDDSGFICDKYINIDHRIQVFHTENRGLAAARNLGINNANGIYLAFLDSDDWLELHALEVLVKTMEQTDSDVVVFRNCTEYVGETIHSKKNHDNVIEIQGQDILLAYADGLFRNVSWNKLYKMNCFSGMRFPEGHNYEDGYVTWRQMKKLADENCRVTVLDEELIHIRMRNGSITHTMSSKNLTDYWVAYLERYNSLPEYQDKLIILCFSAIGRMWQNYSRFSHQEKRLLSKTVREMQAFSKKNFLCIWRGHYSWHTKMICLLSQTRMQLLMWMCYGGGRLLQFSQRKKHKLFS